MKKIIAAMLSLVLLAVLLAGCGSTTNSTSSTDTSNTGTSTSNSTAPASIAMDGSSALLPLAQQAATDYMAKNGNVTITASGGGSGTGLNDVLAGTVDIGNSDVYAEEKLTSDQAGQLVDHKVALIGVALIVNSDVGATVKNLTSDQILGIFTGTITNWKDVGGPDEAITIVNRPSSSGTRSLFTKWALNGTASVDGVSDALTTDDSNALMTMVGQTQGAIGYLALSYLVNSDPSISKVQINGVDATYDNIYNNTYQVWGYEHMYTNGTPSAAVQDFLDYMVSDDMATVADSMGYGTIASLSSAAAASR